MKDCLIVSVESRKGGVGKTTAALNLARLLLERRHHAVLFLDADITGTNATDCLDSPFWKDTCHIVQDGLDDNQRNANLLALFERRFMSGLGGPSFVKNDVPNRTPASGTLTHAPNKINVLGSQIYDLDGSSEADRHTCICKPSILFDELHAFWFTEFLQETCQAFVSAIRERDPDRAVAVIIDNSPGYVGIAPAVQEWLTDLGPDKGKFLTVTSLDKQDVLSCGRAIHNLHRLYSHKWETSRQLIRMACTTESGEPLQLSREDEAFFLRLVETRPPEPHSRDSSSCNLKVTEAELSFYHGHDDNPGQDYLAHPDRYLGLVINRVPRAVKRGIYYYDTDQMYHLMHRSGSHLLESLLGPDVSTYADWMVSYDEYIEYQFLQPLISRRDSRMSPRRRHARDAIIRVVEEGEAIPSDEALHHLLHNAPGPHPSMLHEARAYLQQLDKIVARVIHLVEQAGFAYLTTLIHDEWLPGSILRDFRVALQDFVLETGYPFVELAPWEFHDEHIPPDAWECVERLRRRAEHLHARGGVPESPKATRQFLSSLSIVVALSTSGPWWHSPASEELVDLLAGVASLEAMHWARRRDHSPERLGIQRFLAAEKLAGGEWKEFRPEWRVHPRWLERGAFPRLYRACASAQARIIDVKRDAEFLVALIRRLVKEDVEEAPVLPYVRGVAEKVIVRKTVSHEAGMKTIAEGFGSAQYMEEFAEVLEAVLTRWGARQ